MKVDVFNQKNKKVSDIEVKDFTEDGKVNNKVLAQYIYIYQSNQRQGNAQTKDRSQVSGGGKKPFAQKGTGKARAGSIRSPIWRGGGITFGPTTGVNWKKKTTKNFRRSALQNAFSKAFKEDIVKIVDEIKFKEGGLTKQALDVVQNFGNPKKLMIVTLDKNENVLNAFSNVKNAKIIMVNRLNPYELLASGTVLIEQKALDFINEKFNK